MPDAVCWCVTVLPFGGDEITPPGAGVGVGVGVGVDVGVNVAGGGGIVSGGAAGEARVGVGEANGTVEVGLTV